MTPRHARLAVDLFTGGMAASVGIALASLTWRIAGEDGLAPAASPAPAALAAPINLAPLIALAPFGSVATTTAAAAAGPLELRGIFLASPAEASTVLIADDSGPPRAFRIGQTVGGGTIESIALDRVTLRAAGGLQTLTFPRRASDGGAAPDAFAGAATVAKAGSGAPSGVDAIRALIPAAVRGSPLGPLPSASAPEPPPASAGYRVGATPPPALQAAGLRPGDVIERVNGTPLGDPARDQQLIAAAMTSGAARIEIVRDGRPLTLSVPLR